MALCRGCGKNIHGSYVSALGQSWHTACFRCAGCGLPIDDDKFMTRAGRAYHTRCYRERFSPRCAGCGQPISGNYSVAMGKNWHPEHFVCAHCRKPFRGQGFFERDGKAYCEKDYTELFGRRCSVCNQPVRTSYLTNHWGDSYCLNHRNELPACCGCGRLVCERLTGGGVTYKDGRKMCNLCRRTAVDDTADAASELARVRRTLARLGFDVKQTSIPLRLLGRSELKRLSSGSVGAQPAGLTRTMVRSVDGKVVQREVQEVLALYGLPREQLASVLAHELGHVWLFLNSFPVLPPLVEEGICGLAELLWLRDQHTADAAYRIKLLQESNDPVYGTGFRAAQRALSGQSLSALLAHVRRHRKFPS